MDLEFYVRVRTCEKRVTGKQPLMDIYILNVLIIRCECGNCSLDLLVKHEECRCCMEIQACRDKMF